MKRDRNVMLRFSADEHERLVASKPPGEDLAAFARRALLAAVDAESGSVRRAAAFVVAALSDSIEFEEALALFDDHVTQGQGGGEPWPL